MKLLIQNTHMHSLSCKHTYSPQRNTRAVLQAKFYMVPRIMLQVGQSTTCTRRQVNFTSETLFSSFYSFVIGLSNLVLFTQKAEFLFYVRYDLLLLHSLPFLCVAHPTQKKLSIQVMQNDWLECSEFRVTFTANTLKPGTKASYWI